MHQLEMEFREAAPEPRVLTQRERFDAFHREHPEVFRLFRHFAADARAAGRERFGARAIIERIRWHCTIEHTSGSFRLNNGFAAHYARLLVDVDPTFEGFFEFRELRAE